jgi:hypothetical protein
VEKSNKTDESPDKSPTIIILVWGLWSMGWGNPLIASIWWSIISIEICCNLLVFFVKNKYSENFKISYNIQSISEILTYAGRNSEIFWPFPEKKKIRKFQNSSRFSRTLNFFYISLRSSDFFLRFVRLSESPGKSTQIPWKNWENKIH